jgi:hypothetical protein
MEQGAYAPRSRPQMARTRRMSPGREGLVERVSPRRWAAGYAVCPAVFGGQAGALARSRRQQSASFVVLQHPNWSRRRRP